MKTLETSTWKLDTGSDWQNDIRGKMVLMTVQPDGNGGTPTGFIAGRVIHQKGEVLHVSLGRTVIEIHLQYVYRVLRDDEPIPDTLDGLPKLHY